MSMFKKEKFAKSLTTQEIIAFFSFLSDKDIFAEESHRQWLWNKCNIAVGLAQTADMNIAYLVSVLQDEVSQRDRAKIMSLSSESINTSLFWLDKNDKEVNADNELSIFAKSNIRFFDNSDIDVDTSAYKAGFVSSWILVSLVLVSVFYLWNSIGFLSLLLLFGVAVYWLPKKLINYIKNKSAQSAAKEVLSSSVVASSKSESLMKKISSVANSLEKSIENKPVFLEEFKAIKNKTFYILKNIDENYQEGMGVEFLQIENDLDKIWFKSLPDLAERFGQTTPKDKLILETTNAIKLLLDGYLENIFIKEQSTINVQKRYWLSKISSQKEVQINV